MEYQQNRAGTYIQGDERSFTIIAFPIPEFGHNFQGNVRCHSGRLTHLDAEKIRKWFSNRIIDALDKADYVKGRGSKAGNRTDIKVMTA